MRRPDYEEAMKVDQLIMKTRDWHENWQVLMKVLDERMHGPVDRHDIRFFLNVGIVFISRYQLISTFTCVT